MTNLEEQINRLRIRWPQSHVIKANTLTNRPTLVIVPGFLLPKGYNKTIATVLFTVNFSGDRLSSPFDGFWLDLPDLKLAKPKEKFGHPDKRWRDWCCGLGPSDPAWARPSELYTPPLPLKQKKKVAYGIPGHPEWDLCVIKFFYKSLDWDPNYNTLFTNMMLVKQRLNHVV